MKLRSLILCALFAALTAVGSLVRIPIPGTLLVFTLQTFFVFLAGLMLTPGYAMLSQVVYIAVGLTGLPVFSTGGGIAYVLTPSFGFLIGFIICAGLLSLLVRRSFTAMARENGKAWRVVRICAFGLASVLAMYVVGVAYMYMIYHFYLDDPRTLGEVIITGTGIFVLFDIVKLAAAVPLAAAVVRQLPSAARSPR